MSGPLLPGMRRTVARLAWRTFRALGPLTAGSQAFVLAIAEAFYRNGWAGLLTPIASTRLGGRDSGQLRRWLRETDALFFACRTAGLASTKPRALSPIAVMGLRAIGVA